MDSSRMESTIFDGEFKPSLKFRNAILNFSLSTALRHMVCTIHFPISMSKLTQQQFKYFFQYIVYSTFVYLIVCVMVWFSGKLDVFDLL